MTLNSRNPATSHVKSIQVEANPSHHTNIDHRGRHVIERLTRRDLVMRLEASSVNYDFEYVANPHFKVCCDFLRRQIVNTMSANHFLRVARYVRYHGNSLPCHQKPIYTLSASGPIQSLLGLDISITQQRVFANLHHFDASLELTGHFCCSLPIFRRFRLTGFCIFLLF